jgi:hypothetical protein
MEINDKVVLHNTGFRKTSLRNALTNIEFYKNTIVTENTKEIDDRLKNKEIVMEKTALIEKTVRPKLGKNYINKINNLYSTGKNILFTEIVYEVFSNALLVDDYYKKEQNASLKSYVSEYLNDIGGFALLEYAIKTTNLDLLKQIKSICETTINKVCARKTKILNEQTSQDVQAVDFDLNEDEFEDFNYNMKNIGMDEISDLVKKKVLTVVQDEQERAKVQGDFINDLETELSNNTDLKSEEEVNEAFQKMVIKKDKTNRTTLFEALLRNSYKEILESAVIINDDRMKRTRRQDVLDYDVNSDESDVLRSEFDETSMNNIKAGEYSDQSDTADLTFNADNQVSQTPIETDPDCCTDGGELDEFKNGLQLDPNTINMDLIMAEAVTRYTMIETLNTLQLDVITYDKSKKMINQLLK